MKKIETTNIAGSVAAPYIKATHDHYVESIAGVSSEVIKGLIGTYTTNDVLILRGCVVTANIPGTSSVTAGAIYYNGEIYEVDANASISTPSNTLVWSIATTYRAGDPFLWPDGVSRNLHRIDKFQLTNAASLSGLADYNASTVKNKSYTSLNGGGGFYIAKDNRTVHISLLANVGTLGAGATVYTIPSEFRTSVVRTLGVSASTYLSGGGTAQRNLTLPLLVALNTGVISTPMAMSGTDVVLCSFSYLLD